MSDTIRAAFEAACPAAEVRRWLDSAPGIAGWWSDGVEGDAATVGGMFHVTFPTSPVKFDLVVTRATESTVEWHVPESPPWWRGTTIRFELADADDAGSRILFTHEGFADDDPGVAVFTPAWVRFLDNLVAVAESGEANAAVRN